MNDTRSDTILRPAKAADGPALLAVTAAVDAASPHMPRLPGEPPIWFRDDPRRDLSAFLNRSNCTAFLAETGGKPVGFLTATGGGWQRVLGCATVSVGLLPEAQGRGLGTGLFAKLDGWAIAAGLQRLELTVVCSNTVAKQLYDRFGYFVEGTTRRSLIRDGVAHDEFRMAKLFLTDGVPAWPDLLLPALPPASIKDLVIAPARRIDAGALFNFDRAIRVETPFLLRGPAEGFADADAAGRYIATFDDAQGSLLLAALDGGVAGMLALRRGRYAFTAHEAEFLMIVRREYWGSGIGRRLLEAAEAWCRQNRVLRLILRTMTHNVRALRLYRTTGFAAEAVLRRSALVDGRYADHVLMAKRLD